MTTTKCAVIGTDRIGFWLVGVCSVLCAPVWATDKPDLPPPLQLPTYVVTEVREAPPPESWHYAAGPGYEALVQAPVRKTQELLADFSLFRQALDVVLPGLQSKPAVPLTFIFCGDAQFDVFADRQGGAAGAGRATRLLGGSNGGILVLNLNAEAVTVANAGALDPLAGSTLGIEIDPCRQLRREYVHYLYARLQPRPPAWIEEGMAQMIMEMEYDRQHIRFAALKETKVEPTTSSLIQVPEDSLFPADPAAPAQDQGFQVALARNGLMSLPELFAVTRDSPVAQNPLGSVWAKQACAFVHLCLYGEGRRFQKGFLAFWQRLGSEAPTEALFRECFGLGYADMLMELRLYINTPLYEAFDYTAKDQGLAELSPLELRKATEAEIGRIKGEALFLAGQGEAARQTLITRYIRGERDPRLLAVLGQVELAVGRRDRARQFLEAAAAGLVVSPRSYLELARLRLEEASRKPAAAGKLDAKQAAFVRVPLLIARSQKPALPEVYELFAEIWDRSATGPVPEQLALLEEGVQLFPVRLALVYQTAVWESRVGRFEQAACMADHGLALAATPAAQARFNALKAALPQTVVH